MSATVSIERLENRRLLATSPFGATSSVVVATNTESNGVVEVTPDEGKILVARDGFLHRYLPSGAADPAFGGGDGVIELAGDRVPFNVIDIKVGAGGKIYIAGQSKSSQSNRDLTVARFTAEGLLDGTFGGAARGFAGTAGGVAWADFALIDIPHALAVAADGRVAIVGDDGNGSGIVAVFTNDGTLDTSFDGDGKLVWGQMTEVPGTTPSLPSVTRTAYSGQAAAFAPDGRLIVAGGRSTYPIPTEPGTIIDYVPVADWVIKSLSKTGATTWSNDALDGGSVEDVAVLADGSVLAAGSSGSGVRIAKLTPAGAFDANFGEGDDDGIVTINLPGASSGTTAGDRASRIAVLDDGRFYILAQRGNDAIYLARYLGNGTLDSSFSGVREIDQGERVTAADLAVIGNDPVVLTGVGTDPDNIPGSISMVLRRYDQFSTGATVFLTKNGTLKVLGGNGDDTLHVHRRRDGRFVARFNGQFRSFDASKIKRVHLYGFGGADSIDVGQGVEVAFLDGGEGSDLLVGGSFGDTIVGGDGNDRLVGGDGDDVMFGNGGRDHLLGSAGHDRLFGNAGVDTLSGAGGRDLLDAGEQRGVRDYCYGGAGSDRAQNAESRDLLTDVETTRGIAN